MAKRKGGARKATKKSARKPARPMKKPARPTKKAARPKKLARKPVKAAARKKAVPRKAKPIARRKAVAVKKAAKRPAKAAPPKAAKAAPRKAARASAPKVLPIPARLARDRRVLDDEPHSVPSSLNLDRSASSARTGRAEMAEHRADHATMTPTIAAGDSDVNVEDAYFTGDETPGGDNSTPDQDVVEEIGEALGLTYGDDEELKSGDKLVERDKHRWELDPASAEDYRDREQGKE